MKDDTAFIKHKLTDTATRAYQQNIYTYTNFLNLQELSVYYQNQKDFSFIHSETFGGNDSCERQIIRFGSPDELGYDGGFPIACLKVSPLLKKFADALTHRDFLGAILNLGIERNLIGDIVIRENTGYIFCLEHIADFIIDNLTKIKHTNVKCTRTEDDLQAFFVQTEDIQLICASARIDAVVASITKLSRSKAVELFRTQKIFVNGQVMENNSYALKPNDVLVIRGTGKFIYTESGNETRKGRVYIHMKKYV